jgi:hypothetical protein
MQKKNKPGSGISAEFEIDPVFTSVLSCRNQIREISNKEVFIELISDWEAKLYKLFRTSN